MQRRAPILLLFLFALACVDEPTSEETPTPGPTSRLVEEPLPACEEPVPAPGRFLDGLPDSGIDFVHRSDDAFLMDPDDFTMPLAESACAGVVAADLDQDGHADVFMPQLVGPSRVYWGRGGGLFEEGDGGPALAGAERLDCSASAADFDGDGDLDLVVLGLNHTTLLRNEGDRSFEDVTEARGLRLGAGWAGTPSWADFDRDGDLDLYEGRHVLSVDEERGRLETARDSLWRNDGEQFTDVIEDLPFPDDDDGAWLHGVWRDFDDDGDPDLLQVNDFGDLGPNTMLWENLGAGRTGEWSWRERLAESGVGMLAAPMGAAVRDFDGDGQVDLWLSDIGRLTILSSFAPWQWVDVTQTWTGSSEHVESDISWTVLDLDLDGDGVSGVLVVYGPLPDEPGAPGFDPRQPDRFFVRDADADDGSPRFREAPGVFPVPQEGNSRGVARADFNEDGVPDLLIGHIRSTPSLLLGACTENRRLVVSLEDPMSANRHAVGSRVTVEVEERRQEDTVVAGGRGTFSGSGPELYFGLGGVDGVDSLTVRWPDGGIERWAGVCAQCRVRIVRQTAGG